MNHKAQFILKSIIAFTCVVQSNLVFAVNHEATSVFKPVYLLLLLLLFVVIVVLILKVRSNAQVLETLRNELKYLSRTDDLTQLFNRRYFEKRLYHIFERHIRNKSSNSVLMMVGIQGFQSLVNDHGQSAGDLVAQTAANLIQDRVRNTDLCGRFSVDTFWVLLRDTTAEPAQKIAEEVRRTLEGTQVLYGEKKFHTTCSIGIAAYSSSMDSCLDWIQQADQALNKEKREKNN